MSKIICKYCGESGRMVLMGELKESGEMVYDCEDCGRTQVVKK